MKTKFLSLVCLGVLLSVSGLVANPTNSVPAEKTKPCFQCDGTGRMRCGNCVGGQADCPGPCLKLSKGSWTHMNVAGHPPTDLWMKFSTRGGGYASWNQNHVGEVIQMQNGDPVNLGPCKICGGTTKVKCPVCKGEGSVVCSLCGGKKVVPESWTAFDNPKLKNRPTHYKLKDGRELIGREVMSMGDTKIIRTEKENVKVDTADIVSEEKP